MSDTLLYPRFTQGGRDLAKRVSLTEREAGKRATFHAYYRVHGQVRFDPVWTETPEAARQFIADAVAEIDRLSRRRSKFEFLGVVACEPMPLTEGAKA